jgi:hypothetical membrane protein
MQLGWLLLLVSGASLTAIGLYPNDVNFQVHITAATIHFVSSSAAMVVTGIALLRSSRRRARLGRFTLVCGGIATAGTLLLWNQFSWVAGALGWPAGMVERIAAYPLPLWLSVTGFFLLRRELSGSMRES